MSESDCQPTAGARAGTESLNQSRVTRADVGRIVNAARALIAAHERRNPTSEHATLGEEGALWEINFQLGTYRQKTGKKP